MYDRILNGAKGQFVLMDTFTRSNLVKSWLYSAFQTASASLLSILSVFFLFFGMTELQIGFHASITSILGLVVSLSCSGIPAGFSDSRKPIGVMLVIRAVLILGYTLFCIWTVPTNLFYIAMLCIGSVMAVEASLRCIFEYKIPYELYDISHYSTYIGYSSLFNGIVNTALGVLLPVFYSLYDFVAVTRCCLFAAIVFHVLALLVNLSRKPLKKQSEIDLTQNKLKVNPINDLNMLLHNKDFLSLIVPNILRGFGGGIIALIAVIVIKEFGVTEGEATIITSVTGIATLLSSVIYVYMARHLGTPLSCLIGGILFGTICISMTGSYIQFLVIYCIAYIGYNIVGSAIPNMVYQSVDQSIISPFHTWRMALTSLGSAAITPVYGYLINVLPGYQLAMISFLSLLLCTAGYYGYYRKSHNT